MTRGLRMTQEALDAFNKRTKVAKVSPAGNVGKFKSVSKFKNVKTEVDGIKFDSKKEAKRWQELKLLEAAGKIIRLERQVKYTLLPSQERADGSKERAVEYIADFQYMDAESARGVPRIGPKIVEDTKGMRTPDYIIKRKLMLWVHGITISEV